MHHVLLLTAQLLATDPIPEDEDVVAGWVAFAIFGGLALAVALLGWALTKQLRRTEANRRSGAFGPVDDEEPTDPGASTAPPTAPGPDARG